MDAQKIQAAKEYADKLLAGGEQEVICLTCHSPYQTRERNAYPLCGACKEQIGRDQHNQFADALGLPKQR